MKYKQVWLKSRGLLPYTGQPILCEICRSMPVTAVHHIIYRSHIFGKKRDDPLNLLGICLACHDKLHFKAGHGITKEQLLDIAKRACVTNTED